MPESVLTILKFCFLALLYLFLFRVVRVVVKEMRAPHRHHCRRRPCPAPRRPARRARPSRPRGGAPGTSGSSSRRRARARATRSPTRSPSGRGGGCGIVLADDSFVSTVHARVFRRDGAVYVEDLGSRNGTLLNGEPLTYAAPLRRGDHVQFGQTVAEAVR